MKETSKGFKHLIKATGNSLRGLSTAFRKEEAFRQELLMVLIMLPFSFFLASNLVEWVLLIIPLFTLIITELLNSSLENTVDRIGEDYHELSGRAKDMASAAVFINLVFIAVIWGAFILQYFGLIKF